MNHKARMRNQGVKAYFYSRIQVAVASTRNPNPGTGGRGVELQAGFRLPWTSRVHGRRPAVVGADLPRAVVSAVTLYLLSVPGSEPGIPHLEMSAY